MANQALLKSEAPDEGAVTQTAPAILIADDDPAIRLILRHRLEAAGYDVSEAADSNAALAALKSNRFDAALLDIIMPGAGGLEVLSAAQAESVRTVIIVITAASTMSNAVEAIKRGAHDYLTKPFHNLDLVAAAIERAVELSAQNAEINRLKTEVGHHLVGGEIVGRSHAMQEIYKLIGRLVNNDANVLICGESGTGKELVARAIHFKSERWRAPFVAVNCSAIPQGLLESELFGHERGAFTGATERRAGKFELAGRGTLFLDEISDMPIELQPKLLRALQEREFSAVGSSELRRLQARIIAASNQDLGGRGGGAPLPRRPLFSAAGHSHFPAAPARAARRHSRTGGVLHRARRTRHGRQGRRRQPRGPGDAVDSLMAGQRAGAGKLRAAGGPARAR